jgi:hypothetical protein
LGEDLPFGSVRCKPKSSVRAEQIKNIRQAWAQACTRAGADVKFHSRRGAQVVRMKISGHKTDSMERRYNIVDGDDIKIAKSLMQAGRKKA